MAAVINCSHCNHFPSKADLREKLKVGKAPRPPKTSGGSTISAAAHDATPSGPYEFESSDKGCCRLAIKPQKGRATIISFLRKSDKKFSQKLQIVVKPEELPISDCLCVMRLIANEFVIGTLDLEGIKKRRDALTDSQKSLGLKKYLEGLLESADGELPFSYRPTQDFIDTFEANLQETTISTTTGLDEDVNDDDNDREAALAEVGDS